MKKLLRRLNRAVVIEDTVLYGAATVIIMLVLLVGLPIMLNNRVEVSCYQENGAEVCDVLVDVPFKND